MLRRDRVLRGRTQEEVHQLLRALCSCAVGWSRRILPHERRNDSLGILIHNLKGLHVHVSSATSLLVGEERGGDHVQRKGWIKRPMAPSLSFASLRSVSAEEQHISRTFYARG